MREKLHKMVNPVEQTDIFDAREEQRKKQINEVRQELKKTGRRNCHVLQRN